MRMAENNENSDREKKTENPQVVSVNERERDVRAAVQRVESSNESSPPALDDVDPQQQELENHHQLRQRTPTTNFCHQSAQTPHPGFDILMFLLKKKIPHENKALYRLYMIPHNKRRLIGEICGNSQDGEVRLLSFVINKYATMKCFHTFFLQYGEQVKVAFEITNNDQKNFRGWEEGCQRFDGVQIDSQSQNRTGERGTKATFCVEYLGEEGEPCQEEGEITLTYHSNPVMCMKLLFTISNF